MSGGAVVGRPTSRRRLVAVCGIVVTVAAGMLVHFVLPDTAGSDIAGDVLYVVAVYLFIAVCAPRWHPLWIGVLTAVWCIAVELFQLTGLPEAWGAVFWPIMLVLGTVFDPRDLLVYTAAAVGLVVLDLAARRVAAVRSR
ncbi:DUF2809 domain-containing protein [Microbacterium invictum]|uniref:DUF2809 domain-containing protein n=1 Tax=Microbacterium invictum TaxID=515415 RepID=A0AA40VMM7_9MICO|nr:MULTISPECIES: DUF2809 domain-containing protein [Microbacterium]MBB4139458.1 hypothetical protein [Microbacterium invictum]